MADVVARTQCQCLLINAHTLEKLQRKEPSLGHKVMHNIARTLAERLQVLASLRVADQSAAAATV